MADELTRPGRLIAVDGSRGKDTSAAAKRVVDELGKVGVACAVSYWDASGLFGELASAALHDRRISARTLALVYAADLAFRLRWEIRPVLEAGGVVVAAPYLDTAIAFGASRGLNDEWIRRLLRFAPAPDWRGRVDERKINRPWKRRTGRGFPEYGAAMLDAAGSGKLAKRGRRDMIHSLDHARGRRIFTLNGSGAAAIAKAVTGSRTAAPRRSASRLRNGRK